MPLFSSNSMMSNISPSSFRWQVNGRKSGSARRRRPPRPPRWWFIRMISTQFSSHRPSPPSQPSLPPPTFFPSWTFEKLFSLLQQPAWVSDMCGKGVTRGVNPKVVENGGKSDSAPPLVHFAAVCLLLFALWKTNLRKTNVRFQKFITCFKFHFKIAAFNNWRWIYT